MEIEYNVDPCHYCGGHFIGYYGDDDYDGAGIACLDCGCIVE